MGQSNKSRLNRYYFNTMLVAQTVMNLPVRWETWVQSPGWEDPLEKGTDYPFQYSGLEEPWKTSMAGYSPWIAKSWAWLSDFHFHFT